MTGGYGASHFSYNGYEYPGEWSDLDGDGTPDVADPTPEGSYWWDNYEYAGPMPDADNDGIPDWADPYPNGSYMWNGQEYAGAWVDTDGDGIPDEFDADPNSVGYWYNNLWYEGIWVDSDLDGTPDPADSFPNGSYWWNNLEYDIASWADADADGIPDEFDPIDSTNSYWYNSSEYAGPWTDTDGDFVPDPADSWPLDPENDLDSDGDGLSNYDEMTVTHTNPSLVDTDADYLTDGEEALVYHTDPNNPRSKYAGQTVLDFIAVGATADTDGDGIPDAVERYYATSTQPNPDTWLDPQGDLDGDGVTNLQAYNFGWDLCVNMNVYDQDGDGITDVVEDRVNAGVRFSTLDYFPSVPMDKKKFADAVGDLDGDGLLNIEEIRLWGSGTTGLAHVLVQRGTYVGNRAPNTWLFDWDAAQWLTGVAGAGFPSTPGVQLPLSQYSDPLDNNHNGFPDGYDRWAALTGYTAVGVPVSNLGDVDSDGMSDVFEHRYGFNLRAPSDAGPATGVISPATVSAIDADGDGLSNLRESILQTHPRIADSDGDGLKDGIEIALGLNQNSRDSDGNGIEDGAEDSDGDGLTNLTEVNLGPNFNPLLADTDGDSVTDGDELDFGLNAAGNDMEQRATAVQYNAVNRLVQQTESNVTKAVSYDKDGNITEVQ